MLSEKASPCSPPPKKKLAAEWRRMNLSKGLKIKSRAMSTRTKHSLPGIPNPSLTQVVAKHELKIQGVMWIQGVSGRLIKTGLEHTAALPCPYLLPHSNTLLLGSDTIIYYGLPWVSISCYRHQSFYSYRTAKPWLIKKTQWVRVPLPSPMACLGPGTHEVDTPEGCPYPSEVGHPPPTHTNKCVFEHNS